MYQPITILGSTMVIVNPNDDRNFSSVRRLADLLGFDLAGANESGLLLRVNSQPFCVPSA